jgi:chromosome segregation ATPase
MPDAARVIRRRESLSTYSELLEADVEENKRDIDAIRAELLRLKAVKEALADECKARMSDYDKLCRSLGKIKDEYWASKERIKVLEAELERRKAGPKAFVHSTGCSSVA